MAETMVSHRGSKKKGSKKEEKPIPVGTQEGKISAFDGIKRFGFIKMADGRSFYFNQFNTYGIDDLGRCKKNLEFLVEPADPKNKDSKPFAYNIRMKGVPDPKQQPFSWKRQVALKKAEERELLGDEAPKKKEKKTPKAKEEPVKEETKAEAPAKKAGKKESEKKADEPSKKKRKATEAPAAAPEKKKKKVTTEPTEICKTHGSPRTMQNLMQLKKGGFKCKPESQCKWNMNEKKDTPKKTKRGGRNKKAKKAA